MSDESDGPAWRGFPDVGSLIAHPEGMTVQAALDLAHMDCDVLKDDVRQERTECKGGSRKREHEYWQERLDDVCFGRLRDKVPRGTSEEKETGDG